MATNLDKMDTKSRDERRKARRAMYRKSEENNEETEPKKVKMSIRLIPIWLRLIIVVILISASLLAGLVVGYGILGNGEINDALKKSTWTHIVDLIEAD
ncbi:DNA-directed RNA polymerase subunit beta [Bacillus salitolerans]|uniref:DNA-directed RNA polymerase subunit beta n=1 Tax=Bacillus salitolerans TaxID=1437434 RepID=A0ABW4LSA8_9BACI